MNGERECGMPGPYESHCTDHPTHDYSCYDASKDVAFNSRQSWKHVHSGCPDDGLVSEDH